eukprot:1161625-Pelagomonas_calceolata.AAC.8
MTPKAKQQLVSVPSSSCCSGKQQHVFRYQKADAGAKPQAAARVSVSNSRQTKRFNTEQLVHQYHAADTDIEVPVTNNRYSNFHSPIPDTFMQPVPADPKALSQDPYLKTASSLGLKAPLAYVMSLAMAITWRPWDHCD